MSWKSGVAVGLLLGIGWVAATVADEAPEAPPEGAGVWLGVLIDENGLDGGLYLVAIAPGSPAERAGLERGDVLLQANGRGLARFADLTRVLSRLNPGQRVELEVVRAGRALDRSVVLARPRVPGWTVVPVPAVAQLPEVEPEPSLETTFGFAVADVTPDLRVHFGAPREIGVLVTTVHPGRAAERAGIRVGDLLIELGSVRIAQAADLANAAGVRSEREDAVIAALVRNSRRTSVRLRRDPEVAPRPVSSSAPARTEASLLVERSIELEIEQLNRRIAELKRRLERLREGRDR